MLVEHERVDTHLALPKPISIVAQDHFDLQHTGFFHLVSHSLAIRQYVWQWSNGIHAYCWKLSWWAAFVLNLSSMKNFPPGAAIFLSLQSCKIEASEDGMRSPIYSGSTAAVDAVGYIPIRHQKVGPQVPKATSPSPLSSTQHQVDEGCTHGCQDAHRNHLRKSEGFVAIATFAQKPTPSLPVWDI